MGAAIDELLERNARHAAGHRPHGPAPPTLEVAVVTCMDARIDTGAAFGLSEGEAHVIRNAGGIVTDDVIRSLSLSQGVLGTREVMIVMHTDCGLGSLGERDLKARIAEAAGAEPDFELGAFSDFESVLRASMRRVRESPVLAARDRVRGFVYDLGDGSLREVAG